MENTNLYKEFYFKEIERRNELNNDINLPILIISGIVSIQVYFYSQLESKEISLIFVAISGITFLSGLYSIFYLARSFTNFFRNHEYQELANMDSFLEFENDLIANNNEAAQEKFNAHLNTELANCHKINFEVNIKRTEDIARSKKGVFLAIILTLAFAIIYIFFNYSKMDKKEEPKKLESKETTKMEIKTVGPKSVKIKCCLTSKDSTKKK